MGIETERDLDRTWWRRAEYDKDDGWCWQYQYLEGHDGGLYVTGESPHHLEPVQDDYFPTILKLIENGTFVPCPRDGSDLIGVWNRKDDGSPVEVYMKGNRWKNSIGLSVEQFRQQVAEGLYDRASGFTDVSGLLGWWYSGDALVRTEAFGDTFRLVGSDGGIVSMSPDKFRESLTLGRCHKAHEFGLDLAGTWKLWGYYGVTLEMVGGVLYGFDSKMNHRDRLAIVDIGLFRDMIIDGRAVPARPSEPGEVNITTRRMETKVQTVRDYIKAAIEEHGPLMNRAIYTNKCPPSVRHRDDFTNLTQKAWGSCCRSGNRAMIELASRCPPDVKGLLEFGQRKGKAWQLYCIELAGLLERYNARKEPAAIPHGEILLAAKTAVDKAA